MQKVRIIDLLTHSTDALSAFNNYLNDLDTFFMILSSEYGVKLYPRESLIVFDEIQRFPKAREAVKYLVAGGRYDYIETGSLISIKENVSDITIPSEERRINMFPMDNERDRHSQQLWQNDCSIAHGRHAVCSTYHDICGRIAICKLSSES